MKRALTALHGDLSGEFCLIDLTQWLIDIENFGDNFCNAEVLQTGSMFIQIGKGALFISEKVDPIARRFF